MALKKIRIALFSILAFTLIMPYLTLLPPCCCDKQSDLCEHDANACVSLRHASDNLPSGPEISKCSPIDAPDMIMQMLAFSDVEAMDETFEPSYYAPDSEAQYPDIDLPRQKKPPRISI